MANLNSVKKLIGHRCQDTGPDYLKQIEGAIRTVWALIAASFPFPFLRAPKPFPMSLVAETKLYTVENEQVAHFLHLGNSSGRVIYDYKSEPDMRNIIQSTQDEDTIQDPAYFTDEGKIGSHWQIRVFPTPGSDATAYLHYFEAGSLGNFAKMPEEWVFPLLHGVLSIISAPEKFLAGRGLERWRAVTYKEDDLFAAWLDQMIQRARAKLSYIPEGRIQDALTATRVEGVNDI